MRLGCYPRGCQGVLNGGDDETVPKPFLFLDSFPFVLSTFLGGSTSGVSSNGGVPYRVNPGDAGRYAGELRASKEATPRFGLLPVFKRIVQ